MIKTIKKQREMRRQREQRRKELEWRLNWLIQHESKVDPEVRTAAIDFLKGSIAELEAYRQIKNTLRLGRASLRHRLRNLVVTILAQTMSTGK